MCFRRVWHDTCNQGGFEVFREAREREEWNEAVEGLGGSVLQSWEWGEFRRHHGWRPMRLLGEEGAAQVLLRSAPGLGSIAYAPHGPLAPDDGDLGSVIEAVSERAKGEGAHLIDVEPRVGEGEFPAGSGFEKIESIQPRCTLVIDVLEDAEKQLAAFPKDTRYGVRRAGREGVEAGPSTDVEGDLEAFMGLHEETARRQEFAVRPREYYRRLMRELPARLIVAKQGDELMAGAVILVFGEEAFYLYGASTRRGTIFMLRTSRSSRRFRRRGRTARSGTTCTACRALRPRITLCGACTNSRRSSAVARRGTPGRTRRSSARVEPGFSRRG